MMMLPRASGEITMSWGTRGVDWLLIGYVILLSVQIGIREDLNVAPSDACLLLYALLALSRITYVTSVWSPWHWALAAVIGLGVWVSVIARGEPTRYVLVNKCVGMGVLFLSYACFTSYANNWAKIRAVLRSLVAGVVIENLFAVIAFCVSRYTGIRIPGFNEEGYRLSGMLLDANGYGGLLVTALAINELTAGSELAVTKGWIRIFASATLLVGIVLTFSRSTWFSLSTILFLMFIWRRAVAGRILRMVAVGVPIGLFFASSGFRDFAERMAQRPQQAEGRVRILSTALHYFPESPIFGIGLGTFFDREQVIIHNSSAWFLTEFGLVGFSVFAALILWFFVIGGRALRQAPVGAIAIVWALIIAHAGLFALSFGIEAFYKREWWVVMALLASAYKLACSPKCLDYRPAAIVVTRGSKRFAAAE